MADDTQQLVGNRYRLIQRLGAGGMGEVWEGEDTVLGRPVAVKIVGLGLLPEDRRAEVRARVMREGRAAAQIDHPRSVRVYDVADDDDHLYLVMELVRATRLDEEVVRDGPLDPRAAARLGLDLIEPLAVAHDAGVVHRDVKPGNVMILADGSVKLADFGIAAITDDPDLTATGLVLGTPKYISPEAAQGERVGPAADLWGLGALLYFVVEGEPPFDRGSTMPTLHAVLYDEPRPMQRAGALAPLITALLAKDPTQRPNDDETRQMLTDVLASAVPVVEQTRVFERTAPVPARSHRGGWMAAAVLVVLALIGATALAVAQQRTTDDDNASTTTTIAAAPEPTAVGAAGGAAPEATAAPTTATTAVLASEPSSSDRPRGVPDDWVTYSGDGWTIWHPDGWTARGAGAGQTDLVAPDGTYVRVASVSPASNGGDPVAAWETQERGFAQRHPDYQRITIEPVDYRGYDAAVWEYTFEGRHADNLGFVIGDTGYALNFVTALDTWDDTSELRDGFRAAFTPASA